MAGAGRLRGRAGNLWLRLGGLALVVYGVIGIGILAIGATSLSRPFDEVGALSDAIVTQRDELSRTLDRTQETLGDASAAFANFETSIAQAQRSSAEAAALTRSMSATMSGLARSMELQVLGAQPLIGLAPGFDQAAGQLTTLGDDLNGIGSALGANSGDLATTRDNVTALQQQVVRLRTAVDRTPDFAATRSAIGTLRTVLYLVVAWLSLLAAACLVLGVGLIRAGSRG